MGGTYPALSLYTGYVPLQVGMAYPAAYAAYPTAFAAYPLILAPN